MLKTEPDKYPHCPGEAIKILYNNRKSSTHCYYKTPTKHGWCGTCKANTEEGERGYCPTYEPADNTKKENTIVKLDSNWGFCSKLCDNLVSDTPTQLQETKVTIMEDSECKIFTEPLEFELDFTPSMPIQFFSF